VIYRVAKIREPDPRGPPCVHNLVQATDYIPRLIDMRSQYL